MTYLWAQNNIQNISMRLARKNVQGILKINYTKKAALNKYVFSWALNWATVGELRIYMGTAFHSVGAATAKQGPLTVGFSVTHIFLLGWVGVVC